MVVDWREQPGNGADGAAESGRRTREAAVCGGGGADWLLSSLGLISSGESEPRHRAQSRSRLQILVDLGPFLF